MLVRDYAKKVVNSQFLKVLTKDAGEFVEEEHPRGHEGNPGQFVKKEEATTVSKSKEKTKKQAKSAHEKKPIKVMPYPKITPIEKDFVDTKRGPNIIVENKKGEKIEKPGELLDANGNPLPEHIKKYPIPPQWQHVRFNPDPNGELIAMGTDQKGHRQSRYSIEHDERVRVKKFAKVRNLNNEIENINKNISEAYKTKDKDTALCLKLIEQEGVRADSEGNKGDVKIYGATTIKTKHIKIDDNGKVVLKFIGKHGVENKYTVKDPILIEELKKRAENPDRNARVFDTNYHKLSAFTKQATDGKYSPKDFRTRVGTNTAKKAMEHIKAPKNQKEYDKAVKIVAQVASKQLNNTAAVCLKEYIDPIIFAKWKEILH
jgi:DNA topoisomerase I